MEPQQEVVEKNTSQKVIIGSVILLLVAMIGLYFSGFSFRKFFLGDSAENGEKIATVLNIQGAFKRQPKDSLEFLGVDEKEDLYNEDTVMTGSEDSARIELIDGSILELDPGSLVRLSFDTSLNLGGVDRRVLVEVVSGNVKSQLKRDDSIVIQRVEKLDRKPRPAPTTTPEPVSTPTPPPSPTPIPTPTPSYAPLKSPPQFIAPKMGETLKVSVGARPPVKAAMVFESPETPNGEFLLSLKSKSGIEVFRDTVKLQNGRAEIEHEFESPGQYIAEVSHPDGSPVSESGIKHPFRIGAEFTGIEVEPPLVSGKQIDNNKLSGKRIKNFDAVLRWKGYRGVSKYQIELKDPTDQVILTKWVEGEEFKLPPSINAGKPFSYKIKARLKGGYIVTSEKTAFGFNYLSPELTLPKNNFKVSAAQVSNSKRSGVLFTWQRTNFTDRYEFEIAPNRDFIQPKNVLIKENFLIYRNLKPGTYYWRVRSVSGAMRSKPGQVYSIVVTP